MSFAYTDKKGPYMTVYLAPRIQEAYEATGVNLDHTLPTHEGTWSWHPASQKEWQNRDYVGSG